MKALGLGAPAGNAIHKAGTFCYKEHCSVLLPVRRFKHRMSGTVNLAPGPALKSLIAFLAAFAASLAPAQSPAANDELFRYRGADRDARLAEPARKEGSVVLYT